MCTILGPWRDVDFTINLTKERVFIDKFYRTKHTETYNCHVPNTSQLHFSQNQGKKGLFFVQIRCF